MNNLRIPEGGGQSRQIQTVSELNSARSDHFARASDVPGFCRSAPLDEVRKHGHVLTPGRYVGAPPREDDGEPFEDKMKRLVSQLQEQQAEGTRLDAAISENLKALGFWERDV